MLELYEKDPDDQKLQQIKLDHRSIDFKDNVLYLTSDPGNADERYEFAEEKSQIRQFRSDDPSRFAVNIATESLKHGNNGEKNKLGMDWVKKTRKYRPSINDIKEGIKKQEKVQMLLTSGMKEDSDDFKEAYEGKCLAWDSYF